MSERVKLEALATIVVPAVPKSTTRISLNKNRLQSKRWLIRKSGRAESNSWMITMMPIPKKLHLVIRCQKDKSREKGSVIHRRENRIIMTKINPLRMKVSAPRITMLGRVSSWNSRKSCSHRQLVMMVIMLMTILKRMEQLWRLVAQMLMMIWSPKCPKTIQDQSLQKLEGTSSKNRKEALQCKAILIIITSHLLHTVNKVLMVNLLKGYHNLRESNKMVGVSHTTLRKTIFNLNKSSTRETMTNIAIWEIAQIRIASM